MIFVLFVQSVDVPSLEDKVRKMIDEDLVVSNFILEFTNLCDMNPEFVWSHWIICILSGVLKVFPGFHLYALAPILIDET